MSADYNLWTSRTFFEPIVRILTGEPKISEMNRTKASKLTSEARISDSSKPQLENPKTKPPPPVAKLPPTVFPNGSLCGHQMKHRELMVYNPRNRRSDTGVTIRPRRRPISKGLKRV